MSTKSPQQAARLFAGKAIRDGYAPEALHVYTDRDGKPLHWRIRLKHPETGEKWIRPMKLNGAGYALGEPEYPAGKPLYRLHDLHARPEVPVIVVEGEWCADALAKHGMLATTSGAADSAGKADWSALAGRDAIVWPDNDEAGQRYAHDVAARLREIGCTVRIVDVAALSLPPKGDAVDWLTANPDATPADLLALACGESESGSAPRTAEPAGISGDSSGPVSERRSTQPAAGSEPTVDDGQQPFKPTGDTATIQRLASLSRIDYDRVREAEAKALGVRASTLDKLVSDARKDDADAGIGFDDTDPWPDQIEPAQLLEDIASTVRRFIICQVETAYAVALWVAMTWFMDVVQVAPLAVITAPEKRCGKTQLLSLLRRLVRRPLTASNISPAALFRSIDAWEPTLLVDEADAFMRENEELRGLLNCGHTRDSAYIVRVVGDDHTPRKFNVWGAKALAGIGHLADTLMDRSITLELRRKLPHEQVDRLRYAEAGLFDDLAARLARFAEDYREAVKRARPELPASLNDRAQDNWEPLLAIADVSGGSWPELGRAAALKLSGIDSATESMGSELLADIRTVFEARRVDRISSADLIASLCADEEAPWATYNRGKPISPRQLARKLDAYSICSKTIRIGYATPKGFERSQFEESFSRYLPIPPEISATPQHSSNDGTLAVADENPVAATQIPPETSKPMTGKECCGVADKSGGTRAAAREVIDL